MARLPAVTRDQVPEELRTFFDEVVAIRGDITPRGPTSVLINSPILALNHIQFLDYLRNESSLRDHVKVKELIVLTAARAMDCQYFWNAHGPTGRKAGLSDALVDALRDNRPLPTMSLDEAAVVNYGMELLKTHTVSEATFQAALDQFGAKGLAEITALMGYYAMLAFVINAFAIDLPEQRTEPLLPI